MTTKIPDYQSSTNIKLGLFILAVLIVIVSLVYTNWVVSKLRDDNLRFLEFNSTLLANALAADLQSQAYQEEQRKFLTYNARLYANALSADAETMDFAFNQVIRNLSFPVIITVTERGEDLVYAHRNLDIPDSLAESATTEYLLSIANEMDAQNEPIPVLYEGVEIMSIHFGKPESHQLEQVIRRVIQAVNFPMIITLEQENGQSRVKEYTIQLESNLSEIDKNKILRETIHRMDEINTPVPVEFEGRIVMMIHYQDSELIQVLKWFPPLELFIMGIFILLGFTGFQYIRDAERRGIWVGLSKETAHQLGTPLSSLMGWIELLRQNEQSEGTSQIIEEMDRDLQRLNQVAERFSKIGAGVKLELCSVEELIKPVMSYIERRVPQWEKSIDMNLICPAEIKILAHRELFGWAIENLLKNAVDAIKNEEGHINIEVSAHENHVNILFSDDGEGIPFRDHKNIFRPGWSSKKRGWGLGLSLVERIIREYHEGDILLESVPGQGTTFTLRFKTDSNP